MYKFKHSYTSAAASPTGLASNATGATWTLSANDSGDGLAHPITIRNDSVTDHSGKTAEIVGTGPNGQAQTETLDLPAGSATVRSAKYFLSVSSVIPSATIGSDTVDIGWADESVSPWLSLRKSQPFSASFSVSVDSGSPQWSVQHAYGGETAFDHPSSNIYGEYHAPISAIRLAFTAAGGLTLTVMQPGA